MGSTAISLAESVNYGSAGTIEYIVDDRTGDFFFLEMNTRLQVEHGITELCYNIDLVELMLRQADAELAGKGGISAQALKAMQPSRPNGTAIECRVYAENPVRDYAPCPGTLQLVEWAEPQGSRIDTWVHTGTIISSNYDPLLAKVMYHSPNREKTVQGMLKVLSKSRICGPPTNLEYLDGILEDEQFRRGNTMTKFLTSFKYSPKAIEVVSGGAYTTVQDYPGRPTMGRGFPHAGPMDPLAFQVANLLVGNESGTEGLEITLDGPELRFHSEAVIALCGAAMELHLDGMEKTMWTRITVLSGQKLKIGKTTGGGCRSYLAVFGGFRNVPDWFGSKATSPGVGVGGYQGRQLASGDILSIVGSIPDNLKKPLQLPKNLIPVYGNYWDMLAMAGPYDEGYLTDDDIKILYDTKWEISHVCTSIHNSVFQSHKAEIVSERGTWWNTPHRSQA